MFSELEKLLVIQDRDRRILQLRQEQTRIPIERGQIEHRAQEESTLVDSLKLQVKKIESDRKNIEVEIDAKKQQIAKYQVQQYQTKKNEEYQALGHEIQKAKEEIDELETRELELMVNSDGVTAQLKAEQAKLSELLRQFDAQKKDLAEREAAIAKELEQITAEREAKSREIPDDIFQKYERTFHSKGASAIVGVESGNCQGCHLAVTPTVLHRVKSGNDIVTCENCARILYWID